MAGTGKAGKVDNFYYAQNLPGHKESIESKVAQFTDLDTNP